MTTLLAMFRRPDGGPAAIEALERAYADTHLPLIAATPGLRTLHCDRVADGLGPPTDLVLVTAMTFDDRAALDAALASEPMRAAGRNLRQIAPGVSTLLVLEDASELLPPTWR